ncbi:MAG: FAD-dependent oxidoreductase [Deltaproteobacteria bacterium]|nr:FAD-dependent oxidoreductase [Deltaproteobacteria bacterium]
MTGAVPDVLIVGGGPAGMTAGIWARSTGLQPRLIEAGPELGGQLRTVLSPIVDYPGIQDVDGPALVRHLADHFEAVQVPVRYGCRVVSLDATAPSVTLADGEVLAADALILATGATRRRLGLEGEQRLEGVYNSVSRFRDRTAGGVATIVGGGDSAFEGAVRLAQDCRAVHLVHRGSVVARPDFRRGAEEHPRVTVHGGRAVTALIGAQRLEAVRLDDGRELRCGGLYVRVGVQPRTTFAAGVLPMDDAGYLRVDDHCRCAPGVYAIGDVCSPGAMAVSVAAGQAMIACKHLQRRWLRGGP